MQRVILVVSPDTDFLHQLRSHLEEGGRYQVTTAISAHEALTLANSNFFEVAIVDGEIDDIPVGAFTRDLTALQSDLKILVFPPDNNPQDPMLEGLAVNGFLSKPFSGQEIGKALSGLFSDQPMPSNVLVKVVDDLVKQWLQIPETGGRKAEQILEATSAQTVLIIIKDQLIASAGSMDDGLVANVTGFLSRYWKDEENSELARYIKLDGDGSDQFLYATKLVSNVVLVMVYPMITTIQLVRRELNNVKDDFQQHYPTTGELRQDIAKHTIADINARNKTLESLQPNTNTISQNDIDTLNTQQQQTAKPGTSAISQNEIDALKAMLQAPQTQASGDVSQAELDARKLFEQESLKSKPEPTINTVSQEEIDLLKAMSAAPSQPAVDAVAQAESEARKLFEQESLKSKPEPAINTVSQEEIDLLKAMATAPSQPAVDAVAQAELEARKLFEQESLKSKPEPVINTVSQEEIDLLKAMAAAPSQPTSEAVAQAELEARKLFEQESLKSKPEPVINTVSQEEIDLLKAMAATPSQPAVDAVAQAELEARKLFEQESQKSKPETAINTVSQEEIDLLKAMSAAPSQTDTPDTPAISEQELGELSQLLEQMPSPDPKPGEATPVEEQNRPGWVNEMEAAENSTPSAAPTPAIPPPLPGVNENLTSIAENGGPLPEIDFKLPWEMEDAPAESIPDTSTEQPLESNSEAATKQEAEQPVPVVESTEASAVDPAIVAKEDVPVETQPPAAATFSEVLDAVTPQAENNPTLQTAAAAEEPTVPPAIPSLKDFRFNYTMLLTPGDRNQFLARNLSEKLSSIMPDIHEDQGWQMTSITVRPQYLLWTAAVPLGTCPQRILQEVRNLTSNSIFANFPEIAQTKTSNDFWSSEYLAVSGSEPAPANLILDFVNNAWKNPETATS
jgi:CheY-like chemotaxis protein